MVVGVYLDLKTDPDWFKLIGEYASKLKRMSGVLKVIALRNPEERIYESNVLVVVSKLNMPLRRKIVEAASKAEEELGVEGLSPLICSEKEKTIIESFQEEGTQVPA